MKCAIFSCDNTLPKKHRLDTCPNCRNVFHYWEQPGKGIPAILRRQSQLEKWGERMTYLAERRRKAVPKLVFKPVKRGRITTTIGGSK